MSMSRNTAASPSPDPDPAAQPGLLRTRRLADLDPADRRRLVVRSAVPDRAVRRAAAEICRSIEEGGDRALREAGAAYGGGRADPRVAPEEISAALEDTGRAVREALEAAIEAVRRHHLPQIPADHSHGPFPRDPPRSADRPPMDPPAAGRRLHTRRQGLLPVQPGDDRGSGPGGGGGGDRGRFPLRRGRAARSDPAAPPPPCWG